MQGNSFDDLVTAGESRVREIPAADAVAMYKGGGDLVYLDVRESNEWNLFRIPGAVHIPLGSIAESVRNLIPVESRVVVYCARGGRAAKAVDSMRTLGYGRVATIAGGVRAWMDAGGELEE